MKPRNRPIPPHRLQRARELRRDLTGPERQLWALLRDRRLAALKFRRQHPAGPFALDFYCNHHRLAVELDGDSHIGRAESDARRSAYLAESGIQTLRILNDDVLGDPEAVILAILKAIEITPT